MTRNDTQNEYAEHDLVWLIFTHGRAVRLPKSEGFPGALVEPGRAVLAPYKWVMSHPCCELSSKDGIIPIARGKDMPAAAREAALESTSKTVVLSAVSISQLIAEIEQRGEGRIAQSVLHDCDSDLLLAAAIRRGLIPATPQEFLRQVTVEQFTAEAQRRGLLDVAPNAPASGADSAGASSSSAGGHVAAASPPTRQKPLPWVDFKAANPLLSAANAAFISMHDSNKKGKSWADLEKKYNLYRDNWVLIEHG